MGEEGRFGGSLRPLKRVEREISQWRRYWLVSLLLACIFTVLIAPVSTTGGFLTESLVQSANANTRMCGSSVKTGPCGMRLSSSLRTPGSFLSFGLQGGGDAEKEGRAGEEDTEEEQEGLGEAYGDKEKMLRDIHEKLNIHDHDLSSDEKAQKINDMAAEGRRVADELEEEDDPIIRGLKNAANPHYQNRSAGVPSVSTSAIEKEYEEAKNNPEKDDWTERKLYGGAMEMDVQKRFIDLSVHYPLKDNTEAFVDNIADQSILIECLNYNMKRNDTIASRQYMESIARTNQASAIKLLEYGNLTKKHIPNVPLNATCKAFYAISEQMIVRGLRKNAAEDMPPNKVMVFLALFRWEGVKTDMLISFNAPMEWGFKERPFREIPRKTNKNMFFKMLQSFQVSDWDVFVM
eukprot:jgi/Bigna1/91830/estExt_fgenesh1_pg.C_1220028